MNVCYFDLYTNEAADKLGAKQMAFERLLEQSDYISINVNLTDETRGMFNLDALRRMKPEAYLLNSARGAIVNTNDLATAIEQKVIAGAAIDVFDSEPEENSPLRAYDNVLLTPHVATLTRETFIDMDVKAAQNVIDRLNA